MFKLFHHFVHVTLILFLLSMYCNANVSNSFASEHITLNIDVDSNKMVGSYLSINSSFESTYDNSVIVDKLKSFKIKKIVIDPGHGGKDHGCSGSHSKEKHIALKIALSFGKLIKESYPAIEVIYTRKTDVFIPLHKRAEIANENDVDLFISIHCNYVDRHSVYGTETYVMGLHRAEENLEVAKRENSVITLEEDYIQNYNGYDPNSPEGHILLSMYQHAHLEQSIALAHTIETEFSKSSQRKSRGVKQAGFLVLRRTTMPSVLVETGFLSNKKEEKYLFSAKGQLQVAQNMLSALNKYISIYAPATNEKIAKNNKNSNATYYSIQLTAVSHELSSQHTIYKLHDDIYGIKRDDIIRYFAGPFKTEIEANKLLKIFKNSGYPDAFVVIHDQVYKP